MKKIETFFSEETGEVYRERTSWVYSMWDSKKEGLKMIYIQSYYSIPIPGTLIDADAGKLLKLKPYLSTSNYYFYRGSRNQIKPMGAEHFANKLGISKQSAYRFLQNCVDAGVMARVTVEVALNREIRYYANPLYFMRGRVLSSELYYIFKDQLKPHIPKWVQENYAAMEGEQ